MLSSLRESMEAGVAQEEERQDRARRPQLSSRLPTSFSTLTILAVVLCELIPAQLPQPSDLVVSVMEGACSPRTMFVVMFSRCLKGE